MNTKLILVEGLPGFGKSTTAKLIHNILLQNQVESALFLEGNLDHPADYDGVSCFTKNDFDRILSSSEDLKDVFLNRVSKRRSHYLLPYRKIKVDYGDRFSDELFHLCHQKDIFELPLEQNVELIAEKWSEFVNKAITEDKTYIFECCFIQNPLTHAMIKCGESKEKVFEYILRLEKIIKRLNPVMIYIEQDDLIFSFKKALKERPKEWSTFFVDYYTSQGYGKENNLKGIEGTLKVLEARRKIELELFDLLELNKVKVNNSNYNMENYELTIIEKLKEIC